MRFIIFAPEAGYLDISVSRAVRLTRISPPSATEAIRSRLMDALPPEAAPNLSGLRDMEADPDLWRKAVSLAAIGEGSLDSHGAINRARGTLEGHEEAVASVVDFLPSVGWWWADPIAALGIGVLAVAEGVEAWSGEHPEHH